MTASVAGTATAVALLGGAAAGSAAGVAVTRWPDGRTLLDPPRSRCRACGRTLAMRDLMPVISWLLLRGRCRTCGSSIGARPMMMEVVTAIGFAWIVVHHGPTLRSGLLATGLVAVLVAAAIDLEHGIVPDRLTRPLALVGLTGSALVLAPTGSMLGALAWALGIPAVLGGLALLADAKGSPRPIGAGDIKLLVGVLALLAPWPGAPAALLLGSFVVGGMAALIGLATGRLHRRSRIAFAPAIAVAYLLVIVGPHLPSAVLMLEGRPA